MTEINIQPTGNRVLIKRLKAQTSKGGIILPETAQEKPKQGEVVAVGPGKMDEDGNLSPLHVKKGQKVFFSSYAGTKVSTGDHNAEYLVMSEDEILAVISE